MFDTPRFIGMEGPSSHGTMAAPHRPKTTQNQDFSDCFLPNWRPTLHQKIDEEKRKTPVISFDLEAPRIFGIPQYSTCGWKRHNCPKCSVAKCSMRSSTFFFLDEWPLDLQSCTTCYGVIPKTPNKSKLCKGCKGYDFLILHALEVLGSSWIRARPVWIMAHGMTIPTSSNLGHLGHLDLVSPVLLRLEAPNSSQTVLSTWPPWLVSLNAWDQDICT
jgi:hypothetical protein